MTDLERLIQLQAVGELLARYTHTIDMGDPEGWADCFSPDGRFVSGDRAIVGRDRLRRYATAHNRAFGSKHITSAPLYRLAEDGQTATGRASTLVTAATRMGYRTCFAGWYEDELIRSEDGWLIQRRTGFTTLLPEDPNYPILTSDSILAPLVQPLLDAWDALGERDLRS